MFFRSLFLEGPIRNRKRKEEARGGRKTLEGKRKKTEMVRNKKGMKKQLFLISISAFWVLVMKREINWYVVESHYLKCK